MRQPMSYTRLITYALFGVGFIPFLYLLLLPDFTASLWPYQWLAVVIFVLLGGALIGLALVMLRTPQRFAGLTERVKTTPRCFTACAS